MIRKYAYDLTFQTEALRLAFAPTLSDVGKVAKQLDDGTYWELRSISPVDWHPLVDESRRTGGWQPMTVIFDQAAVIPATPGAILIDEEVDLGPWGLIATTYRHGNFGYIIEKPDGSGGWVPTNRFGANDAWDFETGQSGRAPGIPADDLEGYEVDVAIWPSPMKLPKLPGGDLPLVDPVQYAGVGVTATVGADPGRDWNIGRGSRGGVSFSPQPEDRLSRVRLIARRSDRIYTPAEQAAINPLGYRVRLVLDAVNLVVWEKEVPIPAAQNTEFMHEIIHLSDFGLISDHDRFRFVAEVRRNGKTTRRFHNGTDDDVRRRKAEYVTGEEMDPPTYPIAVVTRPQFVNNPLWNTQNSSQSGMVLRGGWRYGPSLGQCSESVRNKVHVVAWRLGYDLDTQYLDGSLTSVNIDLTAIDPLMNGVLLARSGVSRSLAVVFTPGVPPDVFNPVSLGMDPTPVGVSALSNMGYSEPYESGIRVTFRPGVATLQNVFDAINTYAAKFGGPITTGVLNAPAYVLNQTAEFTTAPAYVDPVKVPVPAGSGDNCTLRVRLLMVPPNRVWDWPFVGVEGANDYGLAQMLLRPVGDYNSLPSFPPDGTHGSPPGLWNKRGDLAWGSSTMLGIESFTTAAKPAPDVTRINRFIMVKDPGQPASLQWCREKADGTFEWVAL